MSDIKGIPSGIDEFCVTFVVLLQHFVCELSTLLSIHSTAFTFQEMGEVTPRGCQVLEDGHVGWCHKVHEQFGYAVVEIVKCLFNLCKKNCTFMNYENERLFELYVILSFNFFDFRHVIKK